MASLRNLIIGILRLRGDRNIAAALRCNARDATRVLHCLASPAHKPDTRYVAEAVPSPQFDNAIILLIPGAMDAGLGDWLFWASLAVALAMAFVAAFPVNRWLIARGRGHAVVHRHHGH
jgi:Domain of unknown function (DUF4396)